ncbi:mucin-5AC-like [Saccoglossus kowalevskii]
MLVKSRMRSKLLLVLCQLLAAVNCEVIPIISQTDQSSGSLCPDGKWTEWFDMSDPQSSRSGGDYELLADMIEMYGVCETPTYIECKEVGSPLFYYEMPDQTKVTCLPDIGLLCFNKDQKSKGCADYEVRFFCPCL